MAKYPEVKAFNLPTYSPEYNPTVQMWKCIKPLVHAAKTIEKGGKEIIARMRKVIFAWINKRLAKPPILELDIGMIYYPNIFDDMLIKYSLVKLQSQTFVGQCTF